VSFRNRLGLFFVLIVIVPMVAVAVLLFGLLGKSERSIRDANIGARQDVARRLFTDERRAASGPLKAVATDRVFGQSVLTGDLERATRRAEQLLASRDIERIVLATDREVVLNAGDKTAIAPDWLPLKSSQGVALGALYVSVTDAGTYAARVQRITGMEVIVRNGGKVLTNSFDDAAAATAAANAKLDDTVTVGSSSYRVDAFGGGFSGQNLSVQTLGVPRANSAADAGKGRLVIGVILLGFLMLALACAVLVSRSLQQQLVAFLEAARRLAGGDFSAKVKTVGKDEFAGLGAEFNKMSGELERRLVELQQERERVQNSMRLLGDAVASKLDRDALLEIVVRTAVDGVAADAGRVHVRGPDRVTLQQRASQGNMNGLESAVARVEAEALQSGRSSESSGEHANVMAQPLRGSDGDSDAVVGVVSVGRSGRSFTQSERELFQYLAGQAARSMESVDSYETVSRESVTDHLTGLKNRRALDDALRGEVARAKRLGSPVGFVLIDLDDFKSVNTRYLWQQGDLVLREVARVLAATSREIDHPARYGGEELAIVLPGTDLEGAFQVAERVREQVAAMRIPLLNGSGSMTITTSCGVAALPESAVNDKALVAAASEALDEAKRTGKNKTVRARQK